MSDIIAMILVFGGFFSFLLAISPVGRAVADRIRQGGEGGVDQLAYRLDQLIEDVDAVRTEMTELNERMDFVERFIARSQEPERLTQGGEREGS